MFPALAWLNEQSVLSACSTCNVQVLEKVAIPVDLADRDALIKAANT